MGIFSGLIRRSNSDIRKTEDMIFPYEIDELKNDLTLTQIKKIKWFFQDHSGKKICINADLLANLENSHKFSIRIIEKSTDEKKPDAIYYIKDFTSSSTEDIVMLYTDKNISNHRYKIIK